MDKNNQNDGSSRVTLIVLSILILVLTPHLASAQTLFKDLVSGNFEQKGLSTACHSQLRLHYGRGQTLGIPEVRNKAITIKDIEQSKYYGRYSFGYEKMAMKDNKFYHYFFWDDVRSGTKLETSNAELMRNAGYLRSKYDIDLPPSLPLLFVEKNRETTLSFSTIHNNNKPNNVLYVAGDPYSSSSFGDTLITFDFAPRSLIYFLTTKDEYEEIQEIVRKYFRASFPDLAGMCQHELSSEENLLFLVLEDSGIHLVQYFEHSAWFQIINSESILSASLTKIYQGKPGSKLAREYRNMSKEIRRKVDKALKLNHRQNERFEW